MAASTRARCMPDRPRLARCGRYSVMLERLRAVGNSVAVVFIEEADPLRQASLGGGQSRRAEVGAGEFLQEEGQRLFK